MFRKIKTNNFYLYSTEVENFFISDFMLKAPGEYVKAYLLALMFAQLGTLMDNESLKRQLGMSDDEIENCWSYWEEQGVIKRVNNDEGDGYDVEFVRLREMLGNNFAVSPHLETSLDDKEIRDLFKEIQKATGRMIEIREMSEVQSWLDDLNINPKVILLCYKYCAANRKTSAYRYVGKVLKDWNAKGLKTEDDVTEYLNEFDNRFAFYKAVFAELGFSRNPTAEEKRMMNAWIDEQGYSLNDILNACKSTTAISNPNLKYVDAVLKNTKGLSEKDEVKRENIAVQINRMYENIRKENEEKTLARRNEIFSRIPKIKLIIDEIGKESLKQTQAMIRRDAFALNDARTRIEKLLNEKTALLESAGYDRNATDAIYSCPKCKDTGVLEDGSMCSCYAEKLEKINGTSKSKA